MKDHPSHGDSTRRPSHSSRLTMVFIAASCGVFAYGGVVLEAISRWRSLPDEQHCFLVAPIAFLLLYLRRRDYPGSQRGFASAGLILVAIAAAMRIYGIAYFRPWLDLWSLPIWIGGVLWFFAGRRVFMWAMPPLSFLFFMAPLPGQLQTALAYPLQIVAANGAAWLLQLIGKPAFVSGTLIVLGDATLDIERACSGLRMFQGMLAVAFAWCVFCRYRWPQFLLMMALSPAVAVIANIVRIALTGILVESVGSEAAERFAHDWAGIAMIPLGAVAFFLVDAAATAFVRAYRDRPEQRLAMTMAVVVTSVTIGTVGFLAHRHRQRQSVGSSLELARQLSGSASIHDLRRASDYYQRYLSVHDDEAPVISEFAVLQAQLGGENRARAARLFEVAWRTDRTRQDDALQAMLLLRELGRWEQLWDRTQEMLPALEGKSKGIGLRLRTNAVSQLMRTGTSRSDIRRMMEACEEAMSLDGDQLDHMWTLAALARANPQLIDDANIRYGAQRDEQAGHRNEEHWLNEGLADVQAAVSRGERAALQIVDRCIADHPDRIQPLVYRLTLLEIALSRQANRSKAVVIDDAIELTLQQGFQIAESLTPEMSDPTSKKSIAVGDERSPQVSAGALYLLAGTREIRRGDFDAARRFLERGKLLSPRNHRIYLALGKTIPDDEVDARIALYESAVENCGDGELTLRLPLAEAYLASGRNEDAERLLFPLEAIESRLDRRDRARIRLMLASTRAGGLTQQDELGAAAKLLTSALNDPLIASQQSDFAKMFAEAQFQLGRIYLALNQPAAAAAAFRAGGNRMDDTSAWDLDAGAANEASGNLAAALSHYQRATLGDRIRKADAHLATARVLIALQKQTPGEARDLGPAREHIAAAVREGVDQSRAVSLLAESFVADGDLDAAKETVVNQLEDSPESLPLRFSLARIHQLSGDLDSALAEADRYTELGAANADQLLLRILIYTRADKLSEAEELVNAWDKTHANASIKASRIQLVVALFRAGEFTRGVAQLRGLLRDHPDDIDAQLLASELFSDLRMEEEVQLAEQNLRRLEGEEGVNWRAVRAERLLRIVESSPVASQMESSRNNAKQLIREISERLPRWHVTERLRGQLAESNGQWNEALVAYRAAWNAGARDAELAGRLLVALLQSDNLDAVSRFVSQLQELIPQSTTLFDRAMPEYVRVNRGNYVVRLAREWANETPNSKSLLRLGQTLNAVLVSGRADSILGSPEAVRSAIRESEQALTQSIEKDPQNLDAWIAAFQLQARIRRDHPGAVKRLEQLSDQLQSDPLRRAFVTAQLFARIGEDARAGELYEQSVSLADGHPDALRASVLLATIRFLSSRRTERAIELCRELLLLNEDSVDGNRMMIRLLLPEGSPKSIDEAIRRQRTICDSSIYRDDADEQRLLARLLTLRASVGSGANIESEIATGGPLPFEDRSAKSELPSRRDRAEDIRGAIRILEMLSPRNSNDSLMLADLYAEEEQTLQAFNLYRESLRLQVPTPDRIARFLEFWNVQYASKGTYAAIADEYYEKLSNYPESASEWLRLQIDRVIRESVEQTTVGDGTVTSIGIGPRNASNSPTSEQLAAQQALNRFYAHFMQEPEDAVLDHAIVEMAEGLMWSNQASLVGKAFAQAETLYPGSKISAEALSRALIRVSRHPQATDALVEQIKQRYPVSAPMLADDSILVGDAMFIAGSPDIAADYYRKTIETSPDRYGAINNLAIAVAEVDRESTESMTLATRAGKIAPSHVERFDTLLVVSILQGDWVAAEDASAALANEYDGLILLHRAYLAQNVGREQEAAKLFDRARDANVEKELIAPFDRRMYDQLTSLRTTLASL